MIRWSFWLAAFVASPLHEISAQDGHARVSTVRDVDASTLGMSSFTDAWLARNGLVLVTGHGQTQVSILMPDGMPLWSARQDLLGGSGFLRSGLLSDGAWVAPSSGIEAHVLDHSGKETGRRRVDLALLQPNGDPVPVGTQGQLGGVVVKALLPDGDLVMEAILPRGAEVPAAWQRPDDASRFLARVSPTGVIRAVIQWLPADRTCRLETLLLPLCQGMLYANAPDGSMFLQISAPASGADSAQIVLRAFDANGQSIYVRRVPYEPVPVNPLELERARAMLLGLSSVKRVPSRAEWVRTQFAPRVHPAVLSVFVGSDGDVWLQRSAGAELQEYLVVPRATAPPRVVQLPGNIRPRTALGDTVIAFGGMEGRPVTLLRLEP